MVMLWNPDKTHIVPPASLATALMYKSPSKAVKTSLGKPKVGEEETRENCGELKSPDVIAPSSNA
jgi:hypothetical protein